MVQAAAQIADTLKRGGPLGDRDSGAEDLPPMLRWLLVTGQDRGTLLEALRHAAAMYRRRGSHQAEMARLFLPVLLTVLIGGGVTLIYALLLFGPWISLLDQLAGI